MPSLELKNIVKNYGSFKAIKDVGFTVDPGEFIVMVGPSGCGKSTLLRAIAGLEPITSGSVSINGRDVTNVEPSERGVAMVFQNYALYPHMSVRDNMGFALKIAGRPKAEVRAAVDRAAGILRITDHLDKKPKQLSGGQKQRVAIGRAITRAPDVFLFDEPLSNLDAALRSQMRVELGRLHAELDATMVYVTHDQTEAMTMASRIVVLNDGEIEQIGSPLELYNKPTNQFVAGFLGAPKMNFLAARVSNVTGGDVSVQPEGSDGNLEFSDVAQSGSLKRGDSVTIGVRAEAHVDPNDADLVVDAKVAVTESLGRETLLYLDAAPLQTIDSESADGYFAVYRSSQVHAGYGEPIQICLSSTSAYLFDASGQTLSSPSVTAAQEVNE